MLKETHQMIKPFKRVVGLAAVGRSGVKDDLPVDVPRLGVPVRGIGQVRNLAKVFEAFQMREDLFKHTCYNWLWP